MSVITDLKRVSDGRVIDIASPMFGDPVSVWKSCFAWTPKRSFDGRWTWLRFIERRRVLKHEHLDGGPDAWWQYRWNY